MDAASRAPPRRVPPPPLAAFGRCALLLDVDGTLLAFQPDPASVIASPALVARLRELQQSLDGALALVSGRALLALDRIFHPLRLDACGSHGVEQRVHGVVTQLDADLSWIGAVAARAETLAAAWPGARIEHKPHGLALHWRGAPAAGDAMRALARDVALQWPALALHPGQCVIDLLPRGVDKGTAIAALLQHAPYAGRVPVFLGDDLGDEPGFAVVEAAGGCSVLVGGRTPSAARCGLDSPVEVLRWLHVAER